MCRKDFEAIRLEDRPAYVVPVELRNTLPSPDPLDLPSDPSDSEDDECPEEPLTDDEWFATEEFRRCDFRSFVCDSPGCGKAFKHKSDFERHELIHRKLKHFACTNCSKRFTRKQDLKRHLAVHSTDKPFVCEVEGCGKRFTLRNNLSRHTKIHAGVRFACAECGKTFTQKTDLNRHANLHTNTRPFVCSECGQAFRQKAHMVAHSQRKHRDASICVQ